MGVMDVEVKSGTVDEMYVEEQYRIFNDKFVDSPELALFVAFDENNERWYNDPKTIMKDVTYNPETKEWTRSFYETTKGHKPSEKQMKKFKEGNYILNFVTEYVQIMETNLVGSKEMVKQACEDWEKRRRRNE